jgi:hypothetical protein
MRALSFVRIGRRGETLPGLSVLGDGWDEFWQGRNERMVAKYVGPAMQQKPPEIFCLTFIMRASRST